MARQVHLLREGLRSLSRHRVRSALMALVTALGLAALIVIVGFGHATRAQVMDRFREAFGGNSMFLRAGTAQFGAGELAGITPTNLSIADLEAVKAGVPTVTEFDPMFFGRATVVFEGRSRTTVVEGHSPAAERLWGRRAVRGSFFSDDDVAQAARVALVGRVVAQELFGGDDPIGQQVRIGNVPFEVIGVLSPGGIDPHGVDRDDAIWVPITTMQRRVANVDFILVAKIGHAPGADLELATLDVTDVLRRRHALGPDDASDFAVYTPVGVEHRIAAADSTFGTFLPLVAMLAVIVGAFVSANLMLLGVAERRGEIGLRKALGARQRDILSQFLAEAVLVTLAGGALAVGLGALVLRLGPLWSMPAMPLSTGIALGGLAVALLVGAVTGVVPARRAAALDPVDALR